MKQAPPKRRSSDESCLQYASKAAVRNPRTGLVSIGRGEAELECLRGLSRSRARRRLKYASSAVWFQSASRRTEIAST